MSETSKDQLVAFEKIADQQVQKLNILLLPLRLVLTHLYGTVDNLFNGSRLSGKNPPRPVVAFDLASRLSYLMPLFNRCPVDQIGASALDVLNAVDWSIVDPDIRYLINYGHLCELMPEVHRDYYEISGSIPLFYLKHSTDEFARSEIKDLFLTSLATPFFIRNRFIPEEVFDFQAAKTDGTFDMRLFFNTIRKYFLHYLNYSFEVPIFTNKGYHDSLNATVEEFIRFRSVWAAIADYCLGMADAFTRLIKRTNATNNYNLVSEVWEWTAPVMKADLLTDLVIKIGGISLKSFNAFMQIFSVDPKANRTKHAGDGFYPPITILKNSYMFNPNILQMMLSSRNIPYAMNKLDKSLFDNLLSHEMEPALVEAASLILSQIPGTIIRKNFQWQHGEIDLLAYSPAENVALHFQAKAAIPAQGARMVQQMEARIIEGIDQLARFQMLKSETQDEILRLQNKQALKQNKHAERRVAF